jgi:hypothetical protein
MQWAGMLVGNNLVGTDFDKPFYRQELFSASKHWKNAHFP